MRDCSSPLFRAASFAAAALALHQLRYTLAFGDDASTRLEEHGHGYLAFAAPIVAFLLAAGVGWQLSVLLRPRRSGAAGGRATRWSSLTLILLLVYGVQESAEGMLAAGHAAGIGADADGGWLALPLAAAIAALLTVAWSVTETASAPALLAASRALQVAEPSPTLLTVTISRTVTADPLARHLAGRAPPRLSSASH